MPQQLPKKKKRPFLLSLSGQRCQLAALSSAKSSLLARQLCCHISLLPQLLLLLLLLVQHPLHLKRRELAPVRVTLILKPMVSLKEEGKEERGEG